MTQRRSLLAFTLIEMLLALTLTAVLLTIVSVTLGAVARDNLRLESMHRDTHQLESVVEVLRLDLQQSQTYSMMGGLLTLHGHAGTPSNYPGAGVRANHDQVVIEYEILNLDEAYWLVRRVNTMGATPTQEPSVELLCGGVKYWDMLMQTEESEGSALGRGQAEPDSNRGLDPSTMSPIPDRVTVSFTIVPLETKDAYVSSNQSPPDIRPDPVRLTQQHLIVVR